MAVRSSSGRFASGELEVGEAMLELILFSAGLRWSFLEEGNGVGWCWVGIGIGRHNCGAAGEGPRLTFDGGV